MDIQKAIGQQRPFRNNYQKVMVNTMFTNGWLVTQLRAFFKPFGVTEKQYNILRILNGASKPLSTSQIRERLLDKMSDTTRVIDRMIKKGFVLKKVNETDRRLVDITLSPEGKSLLNVINEKMHDTDSIVNNLSSEEADTLSNLLDKMRG